MNTLTVNTVLKVQVPSGVGISGNGTSKGLETIGYSLLLISQVLLNNLGVYLTHSFCLVWHFSLIMQLALYQ